MTAGPHPPRTAFVLGGGGGPLGARMIVTGVSGELAAALVALGVDFRGLDSYADLQSGVESARGQAWS